MKGKKIKFISIIFLGLTFLISISCNKDIKNLKNEKVNKSTYQFNLSEEEKLEDYEFFWDFIYNGYPFAEVLERKGVDLAELKEWGYTKLSDIQSEEDYFCLYDKLCNFITDGYYVGHLYPIDYSDYIDVYCFNYTYKDYFTDYKTIKNFYESRKGFDGACLNSKIGSRGFLRANTGIIEENKIAYISIDSFSNRNPKNRKRYYNDIDKFLCETKNYKHLIIDVSHNGGGATEYWEYIVKNHLWDEIEFIRYGLYDENKYTNPYLDKFFLDFHVSKIDIKKIPHIKNANTKKYKKAYMIKKNYIGIGSKKDKPRKDRKIWLLISKKTYSGADRFAGFCKATGWATVVGENTSGTGMNSIGPRAIALPKSGLLIKWDFVYGLNNEGYCNDEVGTIPDIYTTEGKTALETCLDAIKEYDEKH